jgi:hypothetical protein
MSLPSGRTRTGKKRLVKIVFSFFKKLAAEVKQIFKYKLEHITGWRIFCEERDLLKNKESEASKNEIGF